MLSLRDYILVIAEKPKAAQKISRALAGGKALKLNYKGIPYWVIKRDGQTYVIAPSAGHLFTLSTNRSSYPVFEYRWVPRWFEEKNAKHLIKFSELLYNLCKHAKIFINACDYDIEGSVIGYLIIKFFGDEKRAFRVKFSSLVEDELINAFRNLRPLDWDLIEAGLCRHELDWIWGINVSRALSDVFRRYLRRYTVLSAGRVQSPTLIEAYKREVDIRTFVPLPQFTITVYVDIRGSKYKLENEFSPFNTLREAREVAKLIKSQTYLTVQNVISKEIKRNPPPPFNLSDLQHEAYRVYRFSPYRTQKLAEDLYLETLISYPRTNSQKLPPTLNHHKILSRLRMLREYTRLVNDLLRETKGYLKPVEGAKEDPAHPAIYPTGNAPTGKLSKEHIKVYDLIVRRYIAAFSRSAIFHQLSIKFKGPKGLVFSLSGMSIVDKGWLRYYPFYEFEEKVVPYLRVGEKVRVIDVKVRVTYTKPPQRYTKASLLKWMEDAGIGTEATRAQIMETLFSRGYLEVVGGKVRVTDLGLAVAEVLIKYFNELTSTELTRKFEELLNQIQLRKLRKEVVVNKAIEVLRKRLLEFKDSIDDAVDYVKKFHVHAGGKDLREYLSRCVICGRLAEDEYLRLCTYHMKALENLVKGFNEWRLRYCITWGEYLSKLSKLGNTGSWVKEVIDYVMKKGLNFNDLIGLFRL